MESRLSGTSHEGSTRRQIEWIMVGAMTEVWAEISGDISFSQGESRRGLPRGEASVEGSGTTQRTKANTCAYKTCWGLTAFNPQNSSMKKVQSWSPPVSQVRKPRYMEAKQCSAPQADFLVGQWHQAWSPSSFLSPLGDFSWVPRRPLGFLAAGYDDTVYFSFLKLIT